MKLINRIDRQVRRKTLDQYRSGLYDASELHTNYSELYDLHARVGILFSFCGFRATIKVPYYYDRKNHDGSMNYTKIYQVEYISKLNYNYSVFRTPYQ